VLASLDEIPGVAASRVDWTGRRFLLELRPGTSVEEVVTRANLALGRDARLQDAEIERAAVASLREGTSTWMRAGETIRLSQTEAGVLARRFAAQASEEAGLDAAATERVAQALEVEIAAAFTRIHEAGRGLPADFDGVIEDVMRRALDRCRGFLTGDQVRALEARLEAAAGR
jgi:hypothetical protein